jgi:hypothetical protein
VRVWVGVCGWVGSHRGLVGATWTYADVPTVTCPLQTDRQTHTHTHTNQKQAAYGDGQVRLYIFRARRVVIEGEEDRIATLHHLEPCPASRCN